MMKKLLYFLLYFTTIFHYAQETVIPTSEQNVDKNAVYKSGQAKLDKEFKRALTYVVAENYVLNGVITFSIYVNDVGLTKIVDMKPTFKNQKLLLDDLNYVLRKSHKNWDPAQKNNKKVGSIYHYIIDFNTEVYDHD